MCDISKLLDRKCLSGSDECWNKSTGKFQTASVIMGGWLLVQIPQLVLLTCEQVPETSQPSLWKEVQWWDSPPDSWYISSAHTLLDCEHSSGLAFPENQYQLVVLFMATAYKYKTNKTHCVTYFYNTTKFHITDGQLLMSFLGNNFLEHFLQALTKFSLNQGSGSYQHTIDLLYITKYDKNLSSVCLRVCRKQLQQILHYFLR